MLESLCLSVVQIFSHRTCEEGFIMFIPYSVFFCMDKCKLLAKEQGKIRTHTWFHSQIHG